MTVRLLSTAVQDFYERVLDDPAVSAWFVGVDLPRLRRHQSDFLFAVLQVGPDRHVPDAELGARLEVGHAGLGIDDAAFDRVVAHLGASLEHAGLAPVELDLVLRRVESLRRHVVGV